MPAQNIHVLQETVTLEQLCEEVAKLQKIIRYLINGNLDFENVRVKGLTAETIDVDELSAISANMGKLTSGEIYGAYIATAEGVYPRAELSSVDNFFKASNNAGQYVAILPFEFINSAPEIQFVNTPTGSSADLYINPTNGRFNIASPNSIRVSSGTGSFIIDTNNVFVGTQPGITGTFYVSSTSGGPATTPVTFTNGIRTS